METDGDVSTSPAFESITIRDRIGTAGSQLLYASAMVAGAQMFHLVFRLITRTAGGRAARRSAARPVRARVEFRASRRDDYVALADAWRRAA
ncbi:MAG TPA: hypothetical protein VGJ13_01305 [Pseudonocardiaceae bacterium]